MKDWATKKIIRQAENKNMSNFKRTMPTQTIARAFALEELI